MAEDFKPIETQEAFDAAIKQRLERERAKFDEQVKKARLYDEAQEAQKTELEKANSRIAELEKQAADHKAADEARAAREKVAKATGVPAELISGGTEEEMTAFAQAVAAYAKKPAAPASPAAGKFSSGGKSDAAGSMREVAAQLFG